MPKKWDPDSTPSEKLIALFALLYFNDRAFSLKELTDERYLNSSKPTVARLIKKIERSRLGNIQQEKRGKETYYRMVRPDTLKTVSLNAEGIYDLALCRDFLMNLLPVEMLGRMHTSLSQVVAYLPKGFKKLPPRIGFGMSKGRIDYTQYHGIMRSLMQAIREAKVCDIYYFAASSRKVKNHRFAPKALLAYHDSLYAEGWLLNDDNKIIYNGDSVRLAIHRFRSCNITDSSSEGLPDIPLPQNDALGIMGGEAFSVKVWFSPHAATYVEERQWSQDQHIVELPDGAIILEASMGNKAECISWLLGFGDNAKLLEPGWLAAEIRSTLRAMLKSYSHIKQDNETCGEDTGKSDP